VDSSRVVVVTGAASGIGPGIAQRLAGIGHRVAMLDVQTHFTGRSEKPGDGNLPGTIGETAQAVTDAGGHGIAMRPARLRKITSLIISS
jgi:NAD(P)-dependent dehydrogenase (short-subunit alcohol dehydrogenase family)